MEKQDITGYSDQELSLLVNNDKGLYNEKMRAVRRDNFSMLIDWIDEFFIYTDEQLEDLKADFEAEVEEYHRD